MVNGLVSACTDPQVKLLELVQPALFLGTRKIQPPSVLDYLLLQLVKYVLVLLVANDFDLLMLWQFQSLVLGSGLVYFVDMSERGALAASTTGSDRAALESVQITVGTLTLTESVVH